MLSPFAYLPGSVLTRSACRSDDRDHLCVINALDENGLVFGAPQPEWQPIPLAT